MIVYTDSLGNIRPDNLNGFFEGCANAPSPQTHQRILANSDEVVLAIDDEIGDIVGFVTAITDGVLSAFIPLLEVLSAYRGQGIGTELMRRMLKKLDSFYAIDLVCDRESASFYGRFGMKPALGMMLRNYARQSG